VGILCNFNEAKKRFNKDLTFVWYIQAERNTDIGYFYNAFRGEDV
jgi:hypothetical protein